MKSIVFSSASGSPGTLAWHEWRAQGIGASDAPIIAAHHGLVEPAAWMCSQHKLWEMKMGLREKPEVNPFMLRGTKFEALARMAVEKATGLMLSPVFGEMLESPIIRASFDGMTFDGLTIVEIKIPSEKVHELAKSGVIVGYYVPQLVHQALVAWGLPGPGWADKRVIFASFVPETGDLALVQKTGDELARDFNVDVLYQGELRFWASVQSGMPECGSPFLDLAAKYRETEKRFVAIETEKEALRAELIDMLGKHERIEGGGVTVYKTTSKASVDWEKVAISVSALGKLDPSVIEAAKLTCLKKPKSSIYITVPKEDKPVVEQVVPPAVDDAVASQQMDHVMPHEVFL